MSDVVTNFPPQTYSSSFFINSLVEDPRTNMVPEKTETGPILDCFISTMTAVTYHLLLLLSLFVRHYMGYEMKCVLLDGSKTRTFRSLEEYQGNKVSFDPEKDDYQGNYVNFSFESVDRLPKNAFLAYDSDNVIGLSLTNKNLTTIQDGAFLSLFCVHFVDLSGNKLTSLSADMFEGLENLKELNLSRNLLHDVPQMVFSRLNKLRVLNLSGNRIISLNSFSFSILTKLEMLDLGNNQLKTVPSKIFLHLVSLKRLYLNFNSFKVVETDKWNVTALQTLDLSGNRLETFDFSRNFSFTGLEYLNLSHNHISFVNTLEMKRNLPKLQILDVNFNDWNCDDLEIVLASLKRYNIFYNPKEDSDTNSSTDGVSCDTIVDTIKSDSSQPTNETSYGRILSQNEKIITENKKILYCVENLENLIVYMIIAIVMVVLVSVLVRSGFCFGIYNRFLNRSPSGYIDVSEVEELALLRR